MILMNLIVEKYHRCTQTKNVIIEDYSTHTSTGAYDSSIPKPWFIGICIELFIRLPHNCCE
ncbi:hypothetical protein ACU8KH_02287 [Lachancea thermotolerans]